MKLFKKKKFASIALVLLMLSLVQGSSAERTDFNAKDSALLFLRDVLRLDMTMYDLTNEGYSADYPVYYGGVVKEELVTFDLVSDAGNLSINGIFHNGFIGIIWVYYVNGSIIYSQQPSTNAVEEARNILQRYKSFAQNLGWETSHIEQASTMLNNISAATPKNNSPMFNNISGFTPSITYKGNMELQTTEGRVRWIYTEKGTEMTLRSLSINFGLNTFSFSDRWNLYKVGSLNIMSENEAKSIGWEAARNYNVILTYENGTEIPETAKWSNMSEIMFNMVLGQHYKMDQNSNVDPGSVDRDPLSLYPHWQMKFYFGKDVTGAAGVQVGVWGDTKEIAYINLFGYLGAIGVPDSSIHEGQPEDTKSNPPKEDLIEDTEVPIQSQNDKTKEIQDAASIGPSPKVEQSAETSPNGNNNPTIEYALTGGALTIVASIAIAWFVLKKKRK